MGFSAQLTKPKPEPKAVGASVSDTSEKQLDETGDHTDGEFVGKNSSHFPMAVASASLSAQAADRSPGLSPRPIQSIPGQGFPAASPHQPTAMGKIVRRASHAGSWYTDNPHKLSKELEGWLSSSGLPKSPEVRGVIAPHAGYSYSGRAAAYAFGNIDPTNIARVFLLGPSHHYHTSNCALSTASVYETPIGDLPVDVEDAEELLVKHQNQLPALRAVEPVPEYPRQQRQLRIRGSQDSELINPFCLS
uniref:Uncharacterized protein n=1 Tax=Kalanchoe fedtschenkoi TaxID=63787 RepID=A0A7N1A2H0_KALFE